MRCRDSEERVRAERAIKRSGNSRSTVRVQGIRAQCVCCGVLVLGLVYYYSSTLLGVYLFITCITARVHTR